MEIKYFCSNIDRNLRDKTTKSFFKNFVLICLQNKIKFGIFITNNSFNTRNK